MAGILGIQILGILFGAFMVYYTFLNRKRKELTSKEYFFWLFFWLIFVALSFYPSALDPLVRTLSLARKMDFFIILGFMFILGAIFYIYLIVRKNQRRIEEMVRKIAIEEKVTVKDEKENSR